MTRYHKKYNKAEIKMLKDTTINSNILAKKLNRTEYGIIQKRFRLGIDNTGITSISKKPNLKPSKKSSSIDSTKVLKTKETALKQLKLVLQGVSIELLDTTKSITVKNNTIIIN